MGKKQTIIIAVAAVSALGFLLWAVNQQQSHQPQDKEPAPQLPSPIAMQSMANQKCPKLIQNKTGAQVHFPSKSDTDQKTYVTMAWTGGKGANFKTASCTVLFSSGEVSKLVIDDQVLIDVTAKSPQS
ncbi:hypothetical protein [Methylomonas sp. AM2-LC]|uniref:hypothetical protein n=1 Tax=Methylomonas sp. AM2-LC TaxID=3153301 RepID=UPI0032655045